MKGLEEAAYFVDNEPRPSTSAVVELSDDESNTTMLENALEVSTDAALRLLDFHADDPVKQLVENLIRLWVGRRVRDEVAKSYVNRINEVMHRCGVRTQIQQQDMCRRRDVVHFPFYYRPFDNFWFLMTELAKVEDELAHDRWFEEYIRPRSFNIARRVGYTSEEQEDRRMRLLGIQSMQKLLLTLNDAIAVREMKVVEDILGLRRNLPYLWSIADTYWLRFSRATYTSNHLSFRFFNIFASVYRAALQRLLDLQKSNAEKATRVTKLLESWIELEPTARQKTQILVYATDALIVTLALGALKEARKVEKAETRVNKYQTDHQNLPVFRLYQALLRYEEWRRGEFEGPRVGHGSLLKTLCSAIADCPGSGVFVALEAAAVVMCEQGQRKELTTALFELAGERPNLTASIHKLLLEIEMDDEAEELLERVLKKGCGVPAQLDIWLAYAKVRLHLPEGGGATREETWREAVAALFAFLDYGSNRRNEDAWVLLWGAVKLAPLGYLVLEWRGRKNWWPRFHSAPLTNRVIEKKKIETLEMLRLKHELPE